MRGCSKSQWLPLSRYTPWFARRNFRKQRHRHLSYQLVSYVLLRPATNRKTGRVSNSLVFLPFQSGSRASGHGFLCPSVCPAAVRALDTVGFLSFPHFCSSLVHSPSSFAISQSNRSFSSIHSAAVISRRLYRRITLALCCFSSSRRLDAWISLF